MNSSPQWPQSVPLAVLPGGHSVQQGWDSRREDTRVCTTFRMEKYV